jgi:hypothetical protein
MSPGEFDLPLMPRIKITQDVGAQGLLLKPIEYAEFPL